MSPHENAVERYLSSLDWHKCMQDENQVTLQRTALGVLPLKRKMA